jgi:hypothetical protein
MPLIVACLLCWKDNLNNHDHNDDGSNEHSKANAATYPLPLPRFPSRNYTLSQLHVCVFSVVDYVACLVFEVGDKWFLYCYCFGKVLEELIQLYEGCFDLENVVVAGADRVEN